MIADPETLTPSTPGTLPSGSGFDVHSALQHLEHVLGWLKDHLIQPRPSGDTSLAQYETSLAQTGSVRQAPDPDPTTPAGGTSADVLARAASRTPTQYQTGNPGGAASAPSTPLLSPEEFAQQIKAKYPDYKDVPDRELAKRVLEKYPEYKDRVRSADFSTTNATDEQGHPLVRAAMEFYNKSPLAPAVAALQGLGHTVAHPLDTYLGTLPLAETVIDAAKAHWNQAVIAAQKAKDAYQQGASGHGTAAVLSASEAIGHGAAAVLPLLGPAAADIGEHFGRGDIAGGIGGALGLLMPFAAKYGLELNRAPNPAKADLLQREAEQQVAQQVLAPGNPAYKPAAARVAPQVLERGLRGSRLELQQLAEEGKADALTRMDAAANIDPQAPINLRPVVQALNAEIDRLQPTGSVPPGLETRVNALKAQRDFVLSEAQKQTGSASNLELPFEQVRSLRQVLDRQAAEGQVYARTDPTHPASAQGQAAATAAGALRSAIAQNRPELAGPNADYAFHKTLSDILDPTIGRPKQTNYVPTGITGGMVTAGALIGETISDVPGLKTIGALVGAFGLPKLKAFFASPEWQLASAAKKYELANAIRTGQPAVAQGIILRLAAAAPRSETAARVAMPAAASNPAGSIPNTLPAEGRER